MPKRMNFIPIELPSSNAAKQRLLACYQLVNSQGVWTLFSSGDIDTLVHSSSLSPESRFVLPHDSLYVGSSSVGEVFFILPDLSSCADELYRISFAPDVGIQVLKVFCQAEGGLGVHLRRLCSPSRLHSSALILSDDPLLNDNSRLLSVYESLCVPYHGFRDAVRIRNELWRMSLFVSRADTISNTVDRFHAVFPCLSIVDIAQLTERDYWIIANDSSTRILECSVDSRLFYLGGSNEPVLLLGRPLFSSDNSLSISPPGSDLVHPSLGLVLVPEPQALFAQHADHERPICLLNIDYLATTGLRAAGLGGLFVQANQIAHSSHDLVPMLVHHLDYAQTLFYGSRLDKTSLYLLDEF